MEKDGGSRRLSDLLQHIEIMEEQKAETDPENETYHKETEKEQNLLFSHPRIPDERDAKGIRSME